MRKFSLYGGMSAISWIIRMFFLPNPFECFGESAIVINWIAEPIMHAVAYGIVGMFYIKGSAPLLGSIAYLFTYALLTGVLWVMGIFSFAWWWILILSLVSVAIMVGFICIRNWIDEQLF